MPAARYLAACVLPAPDIGGMFVKPYACICALSSQGHRDIDCSDKQGFSRRCRSWCVSAGSGDRARRPGEPLDTAHRVE